MDETPINLENILEQAPKWTFAGDFTLLQWMNQISQDLETRAAKTTESLAKLNNNVRSTNIALDNVANSLTTLQFGNQFVECRVQDDDETLANANEATGSDGINSVEHTTTSKEILNKFLDNNLKVLRNCHEKYSIDLDDSDEDEEGKPKEKTCIYQPINPYNEKPLPFIYGSKDWHAKWHVGLYENQQENNYSGDEISEAFSESSSTSHLDDNESFESNTEWASSNSIDNDNLNTNIEVKNASTLRGSQPLHPGTPSIPISGAKNKATISESSSLSTPSSSLAKKPVRITKPNEISTQRSESKNSLNSKVSSKESSTKVTSNYKDNPPMQYKQKTQPFVDLFAEPPEDLESTTSSSVSSAQNILSIPDNKRPNSIERPSVFKTQPAPFMDLFAEPPEDIPSSTTSSSLSSGRNVKRKTVNLFDDDEDDLAKDDLLSNLTTKKEELVEKKMETSAKITVTEKPLNITKTPKSLFEDSDGEDDDFLKAFAQRSTSKETTKSSLTKTLLFDNEFQEPTLTTNATKTIGNTSNFHRDSVKPKVRNIFNDTEDNEDDLFVKKTKDEDKIVTQNPKNAEDSKLVTPANENLKKSINLFDDSKLEQPLMENKNKSVNLFDDFEDETKEPTEHLTINKKPKKINLFDDLEDDNADDLFSIKPKQTSIKDIPKENQVKSLEVTNKQITTETIVNKTLTNIPANEVKFLEETNKEIKTETIVKKSSTNEQENKESNKTEQANERNSNKKELIPEIIEEKENSNKKELIPEKIEEENKLPVSENNVSDNKESTQFSNDTTTTKIQSESTKNLQTKELNNNDDSKSITQEKTTNAEVNEAPTSNPSNKYDFNSILLFDEPPEDDNAFFETLTKQPQALNNNYNTIDLEHDLYEPELPKVPVTSASSNNQTDSSESKQNNIYTGLQLFSDIPPDDDGAASDTSNHPTDVNSTKRLHSVFYDDFNETLMALNQNQVVKDIPAHSIFSDEPPPITEELSSLTNNDTVDHKVPDVKGEVMTKDQGKLKGSEIAAKLEDVLSKSDHKHDTITSAKRPVSKLQMPHININVQALLPGANTTLRKTKDEASKTISTEQTCEDIKPNKTASQGNGKEASVLTKQTAETPRTAETEHILPSVTKNRVRGPASRRPSTRRARQENYRKSLLEEPGTLESDDENKELQSQKQNPFETITTPVTINNAKSTPKLVQSQIVTELQKHIEEKTHKEMPKSNKTTPPLTSILFEDKPPKHSNSFDVSKSTTMENKKGTDGLKNEKPKSFETTPSVRNVQKLLTTEPAISEKIQKDSSSLLQQNQSTKEPEKLQKDISTFLQQNKSTNQSLKNDELKKQKPAQTKSSLLFASDEEDEDDDLFKHIKTSKTTTTTTNKAEEAKLENNDKNASISSTLFANNSNNQVQVTKPSTSNADPAIADSINIITTKPDNKMPQPTKENDNLFTKSQTNISAPSSQLKTKTEITKKSSFFDDDEDDDDDGDLFKTNITTQQKSNNNKTLQDRNSIAKSKFKSFLDSESDEEHIVAGLQKTTTTKTATSTQTTTTTSSSTNKIPNINIPTKDSNSKLFSDSDSDSDDLFGKLPTKTKTSNSKTTATETASKSQIKTETKSSLFSDDSDVDDFPISSKNTVKNTASKNAVKEIKPKVMAQTNSSLFSDVDSDEDDLFGSAAAKVATTIATNVTQMKSTSTTVTNTKAPAKPITSTAEVTKPKAIADNPLADLL